MTIPRWSLAAFLSTAKNALQRGIENAEKLTIVTGNESADLDSLTSSILYAYIRSSSSRSSSRLYIPLTNIPAADIDIRPEFLKLLPHGNIEKRHLITLDNLSYQSSTGKKLEAENTKWILVDHNVLQGELGKMFGNQVKGVVDHHEEENVVPLNTGDEPRVIEKAGSCTSLVTKVCRAEWDELSTVSQTAGASHAQADDSIVDDGYVVRIWDAQIAHFALASILIDTSNLTSVEKTTAHDVQAVDYLEAKIQSSPSGRTFNRKKFYKEIDAAKKDLDGLQLEQVLRKDYKEWSEQGKKLGISSAVKRIGWQIEKASSEQSATNTAREDAFLRTARQHAEKRGLDIYCIMTTSKPSEGEFKRELMVWSLTPECHALMERFVSDAKTELNFQEWNVASLKPAEGTWLRVWWQGDVGKSRKQVAPLLRKAMN